LLWLWDVDKKSEKLQWTSRLPISSIALSAFGYCAVSASGENTVRIWNVADGSERHSFDERRNVNVVAFDLSGTALISGADDGVVTIRKWPQTGESEKDIDVTIREWNQTSESEELLDYPGAVTGVAMSSDGRWIISGGDGEIVIRERLSDGSWSKVDRQLLRGRAAVMMALNAK